LVALNLLGLLILIGGALIMNELRQGVLQNQINSLLNQGRLVANVIAETATDGDPGPSMDSRVAADALRVTFVPPRESMRPYQQRARLFDDTGFLFADSYLISNSIEVKPLPPARRTPPKRSARNEAREAKQLASAEASLKEAVQKALKGEIVTSASRRDETGERVVTVAIPIQRVQGVVGALVLEQGGVDAIVAAQRKALLPFAFVALGVTLLSSVLLHLLVVRPILKLSAAADQVRLSQARSISLPNLKEREDEIGDLTRSLETMTDTLSARMDAIERFAADVAHEIKNPLTSVRSAVETLELVKDETAKARLLQLLKQDVRRMDRLITDISNASRLDAELSRDTPRPFDLDRLLEEIVSLYDQTARPEEPTVTFVGERDDPVMVQGREGPLGQVFRNLIDNARSFSPPGGDVRVRVEHDKESDPARPVVVTVEDEGPGIPPDNLETIFERFYTSRPKGSAFGGNSGLGLSIARQIVGAHGGRIWAENRVGPDGRVLGARFRVALPEGQAT
jgi:two-component system sensor histidine kinase ChvG